ncbi:MAG: secretin and TonB N-terminal domain-containing protein [Candidatus Omnitrophota bacterium]
MRRLTNSFLVSVFVIVGLLFVCSLGFSQEQNAPVASVDETGGAVMSAAADVAVSASGEPAMVQEAPAAPVAPKIETITLDFKEADIRDVLKIIAYKSGMNIVASPEVSGTVNVRISDVPWERALDVILKTYGYAYDKQDKIIMVAPLEKLTAQRKMEQDLAQVQPTVTQVIVLKFIDAVDAKKAIEPQLSPRGKVTVLEITGQAGWGFGGTFAEKRSRAGATTSRSKTLIVSDIPPVFDKIAHVLDGIDVKPKQVLIETKLVEINLDRLKDFGFDYATGGAGSASATSVTTESVTDDLFGGGRVFGAQVTPSAFGPKATGITAANTGLKMVFQKLSGTRFEIVLHALEENVAAKILSAPSILTLDNQEATILVGQQFPIVTTSKSSDTATTIDVTLEEYKDIGIQLNAVPQISGPNKDYINMIIHPAVTSEGALIENKYPRITTREAQTQVLMKSGETIMIAGLIKDVKTEGIQGVPFLRKIPFIGKVFERRTLDIEKIELLIFITAHIVDDESLTKEQIAALERNLNFSARMK